MTVLILTWTILGPCSALNEHHAAPSAQFKREQKSVKLDDLPTRRQFKVAPYVRAAALLQEMGKEKACEKLMKLAKDDAEDGQVTLLCRLLFSKNGKKPFRAPLIGDPIYIGGTNEDNWPLLPIEIVDDVPFFVIIAYQIGGWPEPSHLYLKYCLDNCQWSKTRFDHVDDKSIEKALKKLLASKKWKRPLTVYERQHLISQTKQDPKNTK